jgi:hypothetical protein
MQAAAWIALFQRIPANHHDNLVVLTTTGAEVVLQAIVYLEPDYMVVRGRTAGSTDTGKVFVLPYEQIDYLGFSRRVSEPDLKAIFGGGTPALAVAAAAAAPAAQESAGESPPAAEASPPAEPPPPAEEAPKRPPQISKSILLARLRARLSPDGKPAER